MDIAQLGIRVESGEVLKATQGLWDLVNSGTKAEQSAEEIEEAFRKAAQAQREFENSTKRTKPPVDSGTKALKLNNQQLTNMQFQLQDIGVGLASGQSPFIIAAQQGSQLSQIFAQGTGLLAAIKATGTGIVSFFTNPINLAVFAVAGLAAGIPALFNAFSGSESAKSEEVLKKHVSFLEQIEGKYVNLVDAARKYQKQAQQLSDLGALNRGQDEVEKLQKAYVSATAAVQGFQSALISPSTGALKFDGAGELFRLIGQLKDGEINASKFRERLEEIRVDTSNSTKMRDFARQISLSSDEAVKAQVELESVRRVVDDLDGRQITIDVNANGLAGISDSLREIQGLTPELRSSRERLSDALNSGLSQSSTVGEAIRLTKAYEDANSALDEQARREAALRAQRKASSDASKAQRKAESDARKASRRAASEARKEAREAQRISEQRTRNESFIGDLRTEVAIRKQDFQTRKDNLIVLEQERAVKAAISRLGKNASAAEIASVRELVPLRLQLIETNRKQEESIQSQIDLYGEMGSSIGNILNQVIDGSLSAEQAVLKLALAFAQAAIKASLLKNFDTKTGSGNFLTSLFGSLISGFRADGGNVSAGKAYVVGERGPEIVVPNSNAYVVPNHRLGGNNNSSNVHVTADVNVMSDNEMFRAEVSHIAVETTAAGIKANNGALTRGRERQASV